MDEVCNQVDQAIGTRVRMRRSELGISRGDLAARLDVSVERVGDFESGAARVSAEQLRLLSMFLRVKPVYFFDLLLAVGDDRLGVHLEQPLADRLFRAFERIEQRRLRTAVVEFVETVGASASKSGKVIPFRSAVKPDR